MVTKTALPTDGKVTPDAIAEIAKQVVAESHPPTVTLPEPARQVLQQHIDEAQQQMIVKLKLMLLGMGEARQPLHIDIATGMVTLTGKGA